jgi:N-terminal acetyltransferase B complex non-catalytic subunit
VINAQKLRRYLLNQTEQTQEHEVQRAITYLRQYASSLDYGKGLAETEMQPGDDLALLTAQAFVNIWKQTGKPF